MTVLATRSKAEKDIPLFLPCYQDEEITAKISRLVSLICLGFVGLFCECFYFVVVFLFYNPHTKWLQKSEHSRRDFSPVL